MKRLISYAVFFHAKLSSFSESLLKRRLVKDMLIDKTNCFL